MSCKEYQILSRRRFLRSAALGAAAVGVQPILGLNPAHAAGSGTPGRFMVIINMLGGNDGLNMVVPAHLTPYVERRQNINLVENIPAGQTLHDLDGDFKLHYNLNNLKTMWDDSDVHIVQKVSYPNPNQSHFTSQDIYSYGVRNNEANGDGRGWLGRFADQFCSDPVEPLGVIAVGVGRRRDFESNVTDALVLNNISTFRVNPDADFVPDHDLRVETIRDALDTDPEPPQDPALTIFGTNRQAYDLVDRVQQETSEWVDPATYPNTGLGRNLRTISQLLHAHDSFGTKVFYTGFGGFDTHSGQHNDTNGGRHASLMTQLDAAMGAFADDMKAKNKWNDCTVVVISEFGRRIFENGSIGTDHGHGNAFVVAGGRVKGRTQGGGFTGDIVEGDIATNSTLPFGFDFRDIYHDIVNSHLGLDPSNLFPDPNYTPSVGDIDVV